MSHTPGPWEASTEDCFNGWWAIRQSGGVEVGNGDGGHSIEDARLIAASPCMLESLKDAYSHIEDDTLHARIGAVIAKAEGLP